MQIQTQITSSYGFTVNFLQTSPQIFRREFLDSLAGAERLRSLFAIGTAAALWLFFSYLDTRIYPGRLEVLLPLRLMVLIVMVIGFLTVFRVSSYWHVVLVSAVVWSAGTGTVALMCHLTEGFSSIYYAGIPLCTIFAASIFAWPTVVALASFSSSLLVYYAPLVLGASITNPDEFLLNNTFIIGTFLLTLLGAQLRHQLAYRAFLVHQQLEQSNAELAALDEAKTRMFQNVSHELRTPLSLMLSPVDHALENSAEATLEASDLMMLRRNGLRLLKQIEDLLSLARLGTSDLQVNRQPLDLVAFLEDLVADCRAAARAHGIEIHFDKPRTNFLYSVDPEHLETIAFNLLSNAIKYTHRGDTVIVRCSKEARGLVVSVKDQGPGMSAEDANKIFLRFEQAERERQSARGGAGIGLALAKELVELLEGEITVQSAPTEGSTFTVTLPLRYLSSATSHSRAPTQQQLDSHKRQAHLAALQATQVPGRIIAGRKGPRVLIAEDDPELRSHLSELLSSSYRVVAVSDGEEALAEATRWKPHLVISDVVMPKLDGVSLCRKLRQDAELSRTAVLLLTARGELDDRIQGRSAGADSYLVKPYEVSELLASVEGLLRARHHLVGDFVLRGPLGSGGQGRVFLGEHRVSGESAAIKIISSKRSRSSDRRDHLRQELRALADLEHPNIVKVLADYEEHGEFFLAMEYLSGQTLEEIVRRRGVLNYPFVAAIGVAVGRALSAVHEAGLLHRDVKCSNIMLLNDVASVFEGVRLIDFGNVGFAQGDRRGTLGTPSYLAPELLLRATPPSVASDIYALAVSLYRMCLGQLPYPTSEVEELRRLASAGVPCLVEDRDPELPRALARVIDRALSHEPSERWPTALALAQELEPLANYEIPTWLQSSAPSRDEITPTEPISFSETEVVH